VVSYASHHTTISPCSPLTRVITYLLTYSVYKSVSLWHLQALVRHNLSLYV
jgi:hypothetical protein